MIDLRAFSDRLVEVEPGFWEGAREGNISYPAEGHDLCLELEAASYWFEHRNRCIVAAANRFPPPGPLFDLGGGNGYVAQGLERAGFEVVVVEPGESGARNARRRGLEPVVCATLETAFGPASLPAAGLFDVVEHVEDDVSFLSGTAERLVPGGRLYLTVPALPWLWSSEDIKAGHSRRYTEKGLRETVARAGFQVEWSTPFFAPLVLPILLVRTLPSRLRLGKLVSYDREFKAPGGIFGRLLRRALDRELETLGDRRRRLGSSLLLVARRG